MTSSRQRRLYSVNIKIPSKIATLSNQADLYTIKDEYINKSSLADTLRYNWLNLQAVVVVAFYTSCHTLAFTLKCTSATSTREDLVVFYLPLDPR
ncbi:hypothetical protein [Aureibacillus halotolerans]|uniref:hypothetical protein n=1 Tax=Aureibacillus halotolerans TaxID=1508390 RepID=UPI0010622661|nr:hypothetical protein [Aureibacillus halotolerans]